MSIEFEALLSQTDLPAAVEMVCDSLSRDNALTILPTARSNELSIRFAGSRPTDVWNEDVTILFDAIHIFVAFHSGTRQQRDSLLSSIAAALSDALDGKSKITFEEL